MANLKEMYIKIFNKYGSNKLLASIIYAYSLVDEIDLKLSNISYIICGNNYEFNNVIGLSIIFSILSINILYDLPHMLNKSHRNGKLTLDNVFGETISQLASFCLFLESTNIILNSKLNNKQKVKIIDMIRFETPQNDYLTNNLNLLDKEKKTILVTDYEYKIRQLICNSIKSIFILNNITCQKDIINEFSNIIVSQYFIKKTNKLDDIKIHYIKNKKIIKNLIKENERLTFMFDILDLFS